jgi:hypothetical protein
VTSPLAIDLDPSALDQVLDTLDECGAAAADISEDDEADWYDDGAIGGGGSGLADAPQGW